MEIEGKVAVVSGGASGIGRAAVLALAERGANVVVADVDEDGGRRKVDVRPRGPLPPFTQSPRVGILGSSVLPGFAFYGLRWIAPPYPTGPPAPPSPVLSATTR